MLRPYTLLFPLIPRHGSRPASKVQDLDSLDSKECKGLKVLVERQISGYARLSCICAYGGTTKYIVLASPSNN